MMARPPLRFPRVLTMTGAGPPGEAGLSMKVLSQSRVFLKLSLLKPSSGRKRKKNNLPIIFLSIFSNSYYFQFLFFLENFRNREKRGMSESLFYSMKIVRLKYHSWADKCLFDIAMNAAAPEGTPPRRINYEKFEQPFSVPPCLGEALRRVSLAVFRFESKHHKKTKLVSRYSKRCSPWDASPYGGERGSLS